MAYFKAASIQVDGISRTYDPAENKGFTMKLLGEVT
jgi:hypothetical protein